MGALLTWPASIYPSLQASIQSYFFLMLRLRFFSIWLRLLWESDWIWLLRLVCSLLRFHTWKQTPSTVSLPLEALNRSLSRSPFSGASCAALSALCSVSSAAWCSSSAASAPPHTAAGRLERNGRNIRDNLGCFSWRLTRKVRRVANSSKRKQANQKTGRSGMSLPANTVAMRSLFWLCATNTHRKHKESMCNMGALVDGPKSVLIFSRTKRPDMSHSNLSQLQ